MKISVCILVICILFGALFGFGVISSRDAEKPLPAPSEKKNDFVELPMAGNLGKAKQMLEELQLQAKHSSCMHEALENLSKGCRSTDDEEMSKFAVRLTSCHFEKSGFTPIDCTNDMTVEQCTSSLSPHQFQTYTSMWLHAESICWFIESERFQRRTETIVGALFTSATEAYGSLEAMKLKQSQLDANLNDLKAEQEKTVIAAMEQNHLLTSIIENTTIARQSLTKLLDEAEKSADRQLHLQEELLSNFERIHEIQQDLGTMSGVVFNAAFFAFAWLMSSTKRTANSRPWLFILGGIHYSIDHIWAKLVHYVDFLPVTVSPLWSRVVLLVTSGLILAIKFVMYADLERENNALLKRILAYEETLVKSRETMESTLMRLAKSIGVNRDNNNNSVDNNRVGK